MKKSIGVAVAAALMLAGCAWHERRAQKLGESLHTAPLLTVRYATVSVAPEPIVLDLKKESRITWRAPAGYTFPKDAKGIEFLGLVLDAKGEPLDLRADPNALKAGGLKTREGTGSHFQCSVTAAEATCVPAAGIVKNRVYRYVIRLLDDKGAQVVGDPHVVPAE